MKYKIIYKGFARDKTFDNYSKVVMTFNTR